MRHLPRPEPFPVDLKLPNRRFLPLPQRIAAYCSPETAKRHWMDVEAYFSCSQPPGLDPGIAGASRANPDALGSGQSAASGVEGVDGKFAAVERVAVFAVGSRHTNEKAFF